PYELRDLIISCKQTRITCPQRDDERAPLVNFNDDLKFFASPCGVASDYVDSSDVLGLCLPDTYTPALHNPIIFFPFDNVQSINLKITHGSDNMACRNGLYLTPAIIFRACS